MTVRYYNMFPELCNISSFNQIKSSIVFARNKIGAKIYGDLLILLVISVVFKVYNVFALI